MHRIDSSPPSSPSPRQSLPSARPPSPQAGAAVASRRPSPRDGTTGRDEAGARFRDLLRKKFDQKAGERPRSARGSGDPTDGAGQFPPGLQATHPFGSHLRPEGPARPARVDSPASVSASPSVPPSADRVLLGVGPAGAEARLAIAHGPLAGSEIRVREGAGGLDAAVLTRTESSRQTLISAMEEVARRLQRKGHVLRTSAAAHEPSTSADDLAGGRDDGDR